MGIANVSDSAIRNPASMHSDSKRKLAKDMPPSGVYAEHIKVINLENEGPSIPIITTVNKLSLDL
jgi:hypothetical protein